MCAVKIGRLGKFDLNPRGELWRKDENRFGHKLLSKFGWSRGKGLGKNEDGIAENLKVRIKLGNTGVGWDEKLPIGIDYREYDAVLGELSKKYQKPGEVKNEGFSLEKRSQQFKNRIHYQKFVRRKDVSQYSEKDMSCIFLSRESEKEMEPTPKETTVTNIESRPADHSDEEAVPTFNSQLSIADYFAMKMKNKMGSSLNSAKELKTVEEASQSETDAKSKKRKHELKSSRKAKRMKFQPELSTTEENLSCEEENASESSSSSQEAAEEILVSEQFQNNEECEGENVKKKKKLSKEAKKLLNRIKSKQDIENNIVERSLSVDKSFEELSQDVNSHSTEESSNMTEKDATRKKRKRENKICKKAKKRCLEEGEISINVEKNLSHSESDNEKINSFEECTTKNVKTEKQSHKESKKHKNKTMNIKSCLKSLSKNKYNFKEKPKVSFCENISYKIIENDLNNFDSDVVLETNEQLPCSDEDCTDSEVPNKIENVNTNNVDDSNFLVNSSNGDMQCDDDVSCDVNSDMVEDNTVPECFKLPKPSNTNYNSWLETQRIAARMKVYKTMVKKMKKHPVLRKTNLLEIKGYGNWGL